MSIPVETMRSELRNHPKYGVSPQWRDKVNNMPDKQVIAIYFRMKRTGEL